MTTIREAFRETFYAFENSAVRQLFELSAIINECLHFATRSSR
jgi:hypothetical protein